MKRDILDGLGKLAEKLAGPPCSAKYTVGTRIQLTGQFLRSTGQIAGGEGQSTWVVQECACALCLMGDFVRTDEPKEDLSDFTDEELVANPALRWRHMHVANVCAVGEVTVRNSP